MPAQAQKVNRKEKKSRVRRGKEKLPSARTGLTERKRAKRRAADAAAQKEFLDDIRVSLEEVKRGELIPADEALKLIALDVDDDEFDRRLHAAIHKDSQ